jgi:hypothetical protein
VHNRAGIREFLTTRRAKITPEQADLQPGGGRHRVPGRALYSPVFDDPVQPANLARFCFLDPVSRDFYSRSPRRRCRGPLSCADMPRLLITLPSGHWQ